MKQPLIFALMLVLQSAAYAQYQIVDKVRLVDRSNGKYITIDKPASLSTGLTLNFPAVAGAADQVLAISSVAGSDVTLGWVTMSASSATLSDVLTAVSGETATPPSEMTGLVVAVEANKQYRVAGTIRGNRVDPGGGGSKTDNIKIKLTGPSNTTFVSLGVRCLDEVSKNPPELPTFVTSSSASVSTAVLNPSNYTAVTYAIEGLVVVGSSPGNITVKFIESGAELNNVTMAQYSHIAVKEIE